MLNKFKMSELRRQKYSKILFKDIEYVEKVGEGTFGEVFKAVY